MQSNRAFVAAVIFCLASTAPAGPWPYAKNQAMSAAHALGVSPQLVAQPAAGPQGGCALHHPGAGEGSLGGGRHLRHGLGRG